MPWHIGWVGLLIGGLSLGLGMWGRQTGNPVCELLVCVVLSSPVFWAVEAEKLLRRHARLPITYGTLSAFIQEELAALADRLAKRWSCRFVARSGGHARAVFATRDEAKSFAERHARAFVPADEALLWQDSETSSALSTELGDYLVSSVDEPPLG